MSVTFVMPVLGRPLFTLRALWYLNSIALPWKVIVADGGDYSSLTRILADRRNFPNLDLVHYRRRDVNVRAFYEKCLNAIRMVETPYVMMIDNDDFFMADAIRSLVAFLDANPDYAAVGGAIASFHVAKQPGEYAMSLVQGPIDGWAIMYDPKYLADETPPQRIARHLSRYFPTCYSVHRKQALADAYAFIVRSGVEDLPLHELFLSLHTLLPGKMTTLCSTLGYLRQSNTSEAHATVRPWPHRVLQETWQRDFQAALGGFSSDLHAAFPAIAVDSAAELVKTGIGGFLSSVHNGTCYHGSRPGPAETMLEELMTLGATATDRAKVESDLQPVLHCLADPEFKRFVREQAPGFLANACARNLASRSGNSVADSRLGKWLRRAR